MATHVRRLRDVHGRQYTLGESDVELLGRPRVWIQRVARSSMAAVSLFQYGYAAALPTLLTMNGWTLRDGLLVLAVWVFCQAGAAAPAAWLYRRSGRTPAPLILTAAALCATGLISLAHASSLGTVLAGYAVAGGVGTGIVYVVSIGAVTEWFPERIACAGGAVSGAFGYGAVPFVVLVGVLLDAGTRAVLLDAAAVVVTVVLVLAADLIRRPTRHWWPAHIDPQRWALDRSLNRSLPNNMPAFRHFSLRAAVRSRALPVLFVVVVLTSVMAFFDLSVLAGATWPAGIRAAAVAVSIAALAVGTGLGRWACSRLSDRLGRRRPLVCALAIGAVAQFVLLAAVDAGSLVAVVISGAIAGAGTGAGYSLLISLVRDWFGDEATLPCYAVVYTGKGLGGVLGIGLAAFLLDAPAVPQAFAVAGGLGLLGALLAYRLRQPGLPLLTLPR